MHSINLCDLIKIRKNDSLSHSWVLTRARCSLSPILTDLSRIIHQIKFFLWVFLVLEMIWRVKRKEVLLCRLKQSSHQHLCPQRLSINNNWLFLLFSRTVCHEQEIQKNKLYFHSSSTASCSIPKDCRLVYIRKLSGVFQHSRQKQEDASTVKEDNLMSAAAVGFLP